jgi:hypothetical protein
MKKALLALALAASGLTAACTDDYASWRPPRL